MFSLINKVMLAITLSSIVFGSISFYGYRTTKLELNALQEQHRQLKIDLQEAVDSKTRLEESIKQDEQHSTQLAKDLQESQKKQKTLQDQIATIPSKRCPRQQESNSSEEETTVADIDDILPPELIGVLKQSYSENTGSTSSASK